MLSGGEKLYGYARTATIRTQSAITNIAEGRAKCKKISQAAAAIQPSVALISYRTVFAKVFYFLYLRPILLRDFCAFNTPKKNKPLQKYGPPPPHDRPSER